MPEAMYADPPAIATELRVAMARPKKGHEKNAPERVAFRIPTWMRAGLDRVAADRKLPISDIANEAFAAYLKRHGIKAEKPAKPG